MLEIRLALEREWGSLLELALGSVLGIHRALVQVLEQGSHQALELELALGILLALELVLESHQVQALGLGIHLALAALVLELVQELA